MGEKRSADECQNVLEGVKALLLDIEGTTTPISFVHDNLFPYVKKNIQDFLDKNWDSDELKEDVDALRKQAGEDKEAAVEGVVEIPNSDSSKEDTSKAVVENVLWQMSLDRKTTALKQLQGHMWKQAYENGDIKGEVYGDVVPVLKTVVEDGLKIYIYSSGSVQAQKLLFGHSDQGDLLQYIAGHFDTKIGAKVEAESYRNICNEIGFKADEVLFLTDIPKEGEAAVAAGLNCHIVVRPGNKPLADSERREFQQIESFAELLSESTTSGKQARVDNGQDAEQKNAIDLTEDSNDVEDDEQFDDDNDEDDDDEDDEEAGDDIEDDVEDDEAENIE